VSDPPKITIEAVLLKSADMAVARTIGRIYVVDIFKHLTKGLMADALGAIWASPGWQQPWGMVVVMHEGATYDGDVRQHQMPPDDKRAVGIAIVSSSQLHRMVIKSIGLGYSLVSRFTMSAHATVEAGVETQLAQVQRAEANKRPF
jgi:hypothetical protein